MYSWYCNTTIIKALNLISFQCKLNKVNEAIKIFEYFIMWLRDVECGCLIHRLTIKQGEKQDVLGVMRYFFGVNKPKIGQRSKLGYQ